MITSKEIRDRLTERNQDGFSTYTLPQIESDVSGRDSFIGEKMKKANAMGIGKEQALNYFAFGDVRGKPENRDKGFFEKIGGGLKKAGGSVLRRGVEMGGQLERIAGEDGKLGVFDIPEIAFGLTTNTYGALFEGGLHAALGVASAITPDSIERPVVQGFSSGLTGVMNAPVISDIVTAWGQFKESSPRAAFNIGGAVEVGVDLLGGAAGVAAASRIGKGLAKGTKGVSKGVEGAKKAATSILPTKTSIADNLLHEAIGFNSSQVRNLSQPHILGTDPVTWLKSKGIIGTRETILDQLDNLADKAEDLVDDLIVTVPGRTVSQSTERMLEQLTSFLSKADNSTKGAFAPLMEQLSDLRRFPEKTLLQHQTVKKLGGKILRMYSSKTGSPMDNLVSQGMRDTYGQVKRFIENQAKGAGIDDVARYNKDVQGAIAISKVLDFTGSKTPYTRLMPYLKNAGRAGFAAGGGFLIGGPGGALAGAMIERLFEIPAIKIFFARRLIKLPPNELDGILKALTSGKSTAETSRIMNGISDDLMRTLHMPGSQRALELPESLSPVFIKEVQGAVDDAIESVGGNAIRNAPTGQPVSPLQDLQRGQTSPTTLPEQLPDVNQLESPKALPLDGAQAKFPNLTPEEVARLTPEERATGIVGGGDGMPRTGGSEGVKYAPTSEYFQSKGMSKELADFASQNAKDMMDMKSPTVADVASGRFGSDRPMKGEMTIYRVVPKGEKINNADFVFTDKAEATQFQKDYGFKRGQQEIISMKVSGEDLIVPKGNFTNEAIYSPLSKADVDVPSAKEAIAKGMTEDEFVRGEITVDRKIFDKKDTGGMIRLRDGELEYSIEDGVMIIDNIDVKTQKLGIGTQLMNKAEEVASNLGLERIELGSFPQNETITSGNLVKFYENLGYEANEVMGLGEDIYTDMSKNIYSKLKPLNIKTTSQLRAEYQAAKGTVPKGIPNK